MGGNERPCPRFEREGQRKRATAGADPCDAPCSKHRKGAGWGNTGHLSHRPEVCRKFEVGLMRKALVEVTQRACARTPGVATGATRTCRGRFGGATGRH